MDTLYYLNEITVCLAFGFLSILQCALLNKSPSDHNAHIYIIKETQKRRLKLPSTPSSIINKSAWGGYPLLLHFFLGKLSLDSYKIPALLLGTFLNLITALVTIYILEPPSSLAFCLFFILFSPYNFDVANATNFGISSRSLGQLFLIIFISSLSLASRDMLGEEWNFTLLALISCLSIIAFNVFATQALIIFSLVALFFGNFLPMLMLSLSLALFLIFFGNYAKGYLSSTLKYWNSYRKYFADISILLSYPSYWLTPINEAREIYRSRNYKRAYNLVVHNSVLNSLLFNPIVWSCLYVMFKGFDLNPIIQQFIVAMFFAFFITSFKFGRFWGEPHRYLEMLTPILVIVMFDNIFEWKYEYIFYFIALVILQLILSLILSKKLKHNSQTLDFLESVVDDNIINPVIASNNNHAIRHFLKNQWKFVTIWSIEEEIVGMKPHLVFDPFPFIGFDSFLKIIDKYIPNALLISIRDDVDEKALNIRGYRVISSKNEYVLYRKST